MATISVGLDASLVSAHIDVDKNTAFISLGPISDGITINKNIQLVPLGPISDGITINKNIQFIALSPPIPIDVIKNVVYVPLQPIRLIRRKYFVTHGE